jgi:formylglycine-generating enzyme required for sulfatase activity
MTALNGQLAELAKWPDVERTLADRLEAILTGPTRARRDAEAEPDCSLDLATLMRGYELLVHELGLPEEIIEPPSFAVCSYVYYKNSDPPEPLLLNSFFLGDLALARQMVSSGQIPLGLDRYLGRRPPPEKRDVLNDQAALAGAVSPGLTPPARWPGPGRHPLDLMQQATVNLAASEPANGGVLGVNGPPGTGKTTLLRDIVAHVVAARAEAMSRFDDPEAAFTHSGKRINVGGSTWLHLYRLCPEIRRHELLVASSNNRAVENVSGALPALESIASGMRYFQTLSDAAHQRPTWGMIAAVLGNRDNLYRFSQTFWWHEDVGMRRYLAAASGTPQLVEEQDPDTGAITHRLPRSVAADPPPATHEEALARWREARSRFSNALKRSREWQDWLVALERDVRALPDLRAAEEAASRQLAAAESAESNCQKILLCVQSVTEAGIDALARASAALDAHKQTRPGWLARLFRRPHARIWQQSADKLRAAVKRHKYSLNTALADLARRQVEYEHAVARTRLRQTEWEKASASRSAAEGRIETARRTRGVLPVDEAFFQLPHADRQRATPWFPREAQIARDEVFQAAIELHRAFIDAAAKPIRHNLGVLMNVLRGRCLRAGAQEALLGDLWATLFLVVPLVSTTFASVERMLGRLTPESLGWLLVDEAGQALPQAAVGALLRTWKALVVGDPLQIEPVVSLPDALTRAISVRMGVDPDRYAAPAASVQTLADAASPYESEFQTWSGRRAVGVPLLVHRRCSEPMFGIANAIAYAGMMVLAKTPGCSPIRDVLGPSAWIHVEGTPEEKWCEEEGELVLRLLRQLAAAKVEPDLYIITPFVIVAERLRCLVRESEVLCGWVSDECSRDWARERIGTVHTAQGREAEAVIFVLGAPSPTQTGARNWAGGRSNLLNVAVSRAREVLYVIGNRRLWREAGVFRELDAWLALCEAAERKRQEDARKKAEEDAEQKESLPVARSRSAGERMAINFPGDVQMTFVWCPPGSFLMGSKHKDAYPDEQPVRRVTLTKGFYMGIHPVTQAQRKAVMGNEPSRFKGMNRPVENVSWDDSQEFCKRLTTNLKGKVTVRLPSEAEWEYACRAGTTTEFHFGNYIHTDLANFDGNETWGGWPKGEYRGETTEVGRFPANSWGLFDMHGNVWEWCEDWLGTYPGEDQTDPVQSEAAIDNCHAVRGGSWFYSPDYCRASSRNGYGPGYRSQDVGIRACFQLG